MRHVCEILPNTTIKNVTDEQKFLWISVFIIPHNCWYCWDIMSFLSSAFNFCQTVRGKTRKDAVGSEFHNNNKSDGIFYCEKKYFVCKNPLKNRALCVLKTCQRVIALKCGCSFLYQLTVFSHSYSYLPLAAHSLYSFNVMFQHDCSLRFAVIGVAFEFGAIGNTLNKYIRRCIFISRYLPWPMIFRKKSSL